jgi:hypothetical protein
MSQDDLYNLEFLSLVAKITQEIDNHTGLNDKTLAEFVIELHDQSKTLADFKAKLKEVGADFPESFVENIDRLVLTLHPKHKKKSSSMMTTPLIFSTFEVTRQAFHRTALAYAIVNLKPIVPGRTYRRAAPILPSLHAG